MGNVTDRHVMKPRSKTVLYRRIRVAAEPFAAAGKTLRFIIDTSGGEQCQLSISLAIGTWLCFS